MSPASAPVKPTDVPAPTSGKYMDLWFHNADTAALYASGLALDHWYAGKSAYDFTTFLCKRKAAPANTVSEADGKKYLAEIKKSIDDCNAFRQIIWSKGTHATFA